MIPLLLLFGMVAMLMWMQMRNTRRCGDVQATFGELDNVVFSQGVFPSTNVVSGRLVCNAPSASPLHEQVIMLPIMYCPSNPFFYRMKIVQEIVDHHCLPAGFEERVRGLILHDNAGVNAIVRGKDVLNSVRLEVSETGAKRALVRHEYNTGQNQGLSAHITSDMWAPLRLTGLPHKVLVFVHMREVALRLTATEHRLDGARIAQVMFENGHVRETSYNQTGRYFKNLVTDPGNMLPYRVVYVGELIDTDVCTICWESRAEDEREHQSCGHWFHEECLDQWLRSQRRAASCPLCRMPLST